MEIFDCVLSVWLHLFVWWTYGGIYGFFGGGYTSARINVIDYIDTLTTTGNASDKGDLTEAVYEHAGMWCKKWMKKNFWWFW